MKYISGDVLVNLISNYNIHMKWTKFYMAKLIELVIT